MLTYPNISCFATPPLLNKRQWLFEGWLPPRSFAHQAKLDCATSSVMTRSNRVWATLPPRLFAHQAKLDRATSSVMTRSNRVWATLPPRSFAHQAMLDCATSSVMTRSNKSYCATFKSHSRYYRRSLDRLFFVFVHN